MADWKNIRKFAPHFRHSRAAGLFHGVMAALEFLVLSVPVRIGVEQLPLPLSPAHYCLHPLRAGLFFCFYTFPLSYTPDAPPLAFLLQLYPRQMTSSNVAKPPSPRPLHPLAVLHGKIIRNTTQKTTHTLAHPLPKMHLYRSIPS